MAISRRWRAAIAEGVAEVPGAEPVVKRVPELVPEDVCRASGIKVEQDAPFADPERAGRL
jgi:NAD(P)H dehydrogenase (quinone)